MILIEQPVIASEFPFGIALDLQPSPYYAGDVLVAGVGTYTILTPLDGSRHNPPPAAQTFGYAVENYDSLLRRLAD